MTGSRTSMPDKNENGNSQHGSTRGHADELAALMPLIASNTLFNSMELSAHLTTSTTSSSSSRTASSIPSSREDRMDDIISIIDEVLDTLQAETFPATN